MDFHRTSPYPPINNIFSGYSFSMNERIRSQNRQIRKRCEDCDEDPSSEMSICHELHTDLLDRFRDLFGEEMMDSIRNAFGGIAPQRKISKDYFDKLGKISLDESESILYDAYVEVNTLKLLVTLSNFVPICERTTITGPLIFGFPEYGESDLQSDCRDKIVVLRRGVVSFVKKVVAAQHAGAKALIVVQNTDKWPFVMTDSVNERLDAPKIDIPLGMMSSNDGDLLIDMIMSSRKRGNPLVGNFTIMSKVSECIICRDAFDVGSTILKLPCRHLYHLDCLKGWLEKSNTCPMCRHQMPEADSS